jgi:hypothetical protein
MVPNFSKVRRRVFGFDASIKDYIRKCLIMSIKQCMFFMRFFIIACYTVLDFSLINIYDNIVTVQSHTRNFLVVVYPPNKNLQKASLTSKLDVLLFINFCLALNNHIIFGGNSI